MPAAPVELLSEVEGLEEPAIELPMEPVDVGDVSLTGALLLVAMGVVEATPVEVPSDGIKVVAGAKKIVGAVLKDLCQWAEMIEERDEELLWLTELLSCSEALSPGPKEIGKRTLPRPEEIRWRMLSSSLS
ncbi:hypothetical protein Nepgr_014545 [Nepenthes gracilis]|uniref:Uncharacterized protein n=1 Tax=Nepenthes gracilis TaxID=150966 RepID=A0AAD3XQ86_NEPGR|nr:hypothetical protein Nepgr_014545 [Nepenthes gracilis]